MTIVVSILLIVLMVYVILLQLQLRSMNQQLTKRLQENTCQPVSLELMNSELNTLAANINKCLKAEEILRLNSVREEKQFKELIANISHDLRTPLTAIRGYQQLMEKGGLNEDQKKKLYVAQKHTDELSDLIKYFFEYTYLMNAEAEINKIEINLTNLVTECLAESINEFEEKKLTVHFQETSSVFILTDKEMLVRIIRNLIRNCISHADGDITVQVLTGSLTAIIFRNPVNRDREVDAKRLFDRFYTADRSRGKTTGLGLSIVKRLAEQLDGDVSASIQNGMFEIRVELPYN